jgi:hypothetical protein
LSPEIKFFIIADAGCLKKAGEGNLLIRQISSLIIPFRN